MMMYPIQSQLDTLYDRYEAQVDEYLEVVRREHVIPFCVKHKLVFSSGNGAWCFFDENKNLIDFDDEEYEDNVDFQAINEILSSIVGGKDIECGCWIDSVK